MYGGWLLYTRQTSDQLWGLGRWLVGGVVLHDVALAAVVLVAGFVVTRVVPEAARAPTVVGGVVLGSVTLLAVPVLGRYGAKPNNPTLLDRDYGLGWVGFATLVVVAVAVASVVRSRADRKQ